jgi:hypothetical protein
MCQKTRAKGCCNLLSEDIINAAGTPGPNFAKAHQFQIVSAPNGDGTYCPLGTCSGRRAKRVVTFARWPFASLIPRHAGGRCYPAGSIRVLCPVPYPPDA